MNPGGAILFVVTLAAWAVGSVYLLMLAGRVYLVVIQGTAAGIDRVEWPDEPIYDWLITSAYFLGLTGLILMPAGILSRALAESLLPGNKALRYLVIAGPFCWFFLPIGLLSSLSATSRWVVLSPRIVVGLLRETPTLIVFYFVTGLLFAGAGALGYAALFSPALYALPLAATALSALWMIHARLVGRIGWLIHQQQKGTAEKSARPRKKRKRSLAAEDPWARTETDESPTATSGSLRYGVVEQPVVPIPARPLSLDPDPDPYTLAAVPDEADETTIEMAPPSAGRVEASLLEREIAMRRHDPPNPPPAWPLWSGVYGFPLYENCRKPFLELVIWGATCGMMFRVLLNFFPG